MTYNLYPEVVSIVLAMWDTEPEAIAEEVSNRLNISFDFAFEMVEEAIIEEVDLERYDYEDDLEELVTY